MFLMEPKTQNDQTSVFYVLFDFFERERAEIDTNKHPPEKGSIAWVFHFRQEDFLSEKEKRHQFLVGRLDIAQSAEYVETIGL